MNTPKNILLFVLCLSILNIASCVGVVLSKKTQEKFQFFYTRVITAFNYSKYQIHVYRITHHFFYRSGILCPMPKNVSFHSVRIFLTHVYFYILITLPRLCTEHILCRSGIDSKTQKNSAFQEGGVEWCFCFTSVNVEGIRVL